MLLTLLAFGWFYWQMHRQREERELAAPTKGTLVPIDVQTSSPDGGA